MKSQHIREIIMYLGEQYTMGTWQRGGTQVCKQFHLNPQLFVASIFNFVPRAVTQVTHWIYSS